MAWVPRLPEIWNEQLSMLSAISPELRVTLYSVSAEIAKLEEDIRLPQLSPLNPELWYLGHGGMLAGGTALGDGIIRGCQKAKQLRKRGHAGSLGLFLLTDGWSKNDTEPHAQVKRWLRYARTELQVNFKLFGFVHPRSEVRLREFCKNVGIPESENKLLKFDSPETRDETMVTSLERLGEEIQNYALTK